MRATIHYVCLPKSKRADYGSEDIIIDVEMPFVPSAGTMLKVAQEGGYLKVEDVFLDLVPGGDGLAIFIQEPGDRNDLRPWLEMKAQGWALSEN